MSDKLIKIKVLIPIGTGTTKNVTTNKYEGIAYDTSLKIKENLDKKYKFEETFKKITDYTKATKDIEKGIWDVGIGTWFFNVERAK